MIKTKAAIIVFFFSYMLILYAVYAVYKVYIQYIYILNKTRHHSKDYHLQLMQ